MTHLFTIVLADLLVKQDDTIVISPASDGDEKFKLPEFTELSATKIIHLDIRMPTQTGSHLYADCKARRKGSS